MTDQTPLVGILMGSDSDLPTMKEAFEALKTLGVASEVRVLSAHRAPKETAQYAESADKRGIRVLIAGAGGAAHLAGTLAAHTSLPVIGVPIASGAMEGEDALYSTVQMPKGVPVATVAISGAWNAGVLAAQILAYTSAGEKLGLPERLKRYKEELRAKVIKVTSPTVG